MHCQDGQRVKVRSLAPLYKPRPDAISSERLESRSPRVGLSALGYCISARDGTKPPSSPWLPMHFNVRVKVAWHDDLACVFTHFLFTF